jgi:hypothetical protein
VSLPKYEYPILVKWTMAGICTLVASQNCFIQYLF